MAIGSCRLRIEILLGVRNIRRFHISERHLLLLENILVQVSTEI